MASQRLSPLSSPLLRLLFKKGVLNVYLRLSFFKPVGLLRKGPMSCSFCMLRFCNICVPCRRILEPKVAKLKLRTQSLRHFLFLYVAARAPSREPAVSRDNEDESPVLYRLSPAPYPPAAAPSLQLSACSPQTYHLQCKQGILTPALKLEVAAGLKKLHHIIKSICSFAETTPLSAPQPS